MNGVKTYVFGTVLLSVAFASATIVVDFLRRPTRRGLKVFPSDYYPEPPSTSTDFCAILKRTRNNTLPLTPSINLNLYPSRDGSREFILCAYPKTGCTQWIMLLDYLQGGNKSTTGRVHHRGARQNNRLTLSSSSLYSWDVPRILITRDPYKRTISSYHDFRRRNPSLRNVTFENFIFEHVDGSAMSNQPADHRRPISEGCSNPSWFRGGWDYVLQLERMGLWLPCLLDLLSLTHIVDSGWDGSSLWMLPKLSNQDLFRIALDGGTKDFVKAINTGHENPGEDLHTPATIRVVNQVFLNDFVLGGYRLRVD